MSRRQRRHPGGRPSASRRVRVMPIRRSMLDHQALARVLLAILAQDIAKDVATNDSAAFTPTEIPAKRTNPQIQVESEEP